MRVKYANFSWGSEIKTTLRNPTASGSERREAKMLCEVNLSKHCTPSLSHNSDKSQHTDIKHIQCHSV